MTRASTEVAADAPHRAPLPIRWVEALVALTGWRRLTAAVVAGAVASLAMPPVGAVPVLLVSFPVLIWLLDGVRTTRGAFAVGWSFAFGFFVLGLYWIAFSLTVDIARFFWALPFAVAGLPALLALFPAAATAALHALALTGLSRVLAFAALWGVAEWLRGHLFTGFPWNLVGYGWVDWLAVLQSVSVIGIYGLSLITVTVASLPAAAVDPIRRGWSRSGSLAAVAGLCVLAMIGWAGSARLSGIDPGTVDNVTLRLVQPNIDQADKWNADRAIEHFNLHRRLSVEPGWEQVTHVIWPETAIPWSPDMADQVRRALAEIAPPGGAIIVGAPRADDAPDPSYWNSLFVIDDAERIVAVYDKFHLVPFGEYMPFSDILPIASIAGGRIDYSAGPGPQILELPGAPPVSPLICYEAIFPGNVTGAQRPAWLLNLTNDAWFGATAGPHQHFAIARTRAVEEGLPLVRVASTGISGTVDAAGRIVERLGLDERGIRDAQLPAALPEPTLFSSYGNVIFWLTIAALFVFSAPWRRR